MATKLYIFDMGGVVVQNADVFGKIYDYLQVGQDEFHKYSGHSLSLLSDGKISVEQFWRLFSQNYGAQISLDLFKEFFHPTLDMEVVNLIAELKHTARVVCGTNTIEPHYDYHLAHGEYAVFDAVYASNKIGVSKPRTSFFRYILEKEKITAAESCFIDDLRENVEAAKKLGIKGITFTGIEALRTNLFDKCGNWG
ncbi:MAG: HAD family hydrolase [Bacillota bacterium]